ncbi:uncharacterized protein LAJ45_10840 [Morchella importuna]|uniref:uncharacterized protein n=1 Tax=Morchella importuna TaxID=1174673 RepID=UPI001E8ECDAB|nr:uncharacterized protein LAJ45_10840 [Morchella importuna]KAH8145176.1 hypothetical protein LAJ45_10840 [Morchella importuna]
MKILINKALGKVNFFVPSGNLRWVFSRTKGPSRVYTGSETVRPVCEAERKPRDNHLRFCVYPDSSMVTSGAKNSYIPTPYASNRQLHYIMLCSSVVRARKYYECLIKQFVFRKAHKTVILGHILRLVRTSAHISGELRL